MVFLELYEYVKQCHKCLLVEGVRDGGVTNNSKSYIETYTKERGGLCSLIKVQLKSCAHFCKYFVCLYSYIFSYLNFFIA